MKKLRLLLFEECNRNCFFCCNNDWNLNRLNKPKNYKDYEEILLTGGEPFLHPEIIAKTVEEIRSQNNKAKIYIYTAYVKNVIDVLAILNIVDGITLTLHEREDVGSFIILNNIIRRYKITNKSFRLNVFKGISLQGIDTTMWIIKDNIVWIKNCPLPINEEFCRLN